MNQQNHQSNQNSQDSQNNDQEPTPEKFDLLEFQKLARETCCPKRLFQIWEDICRRYDRKEIGVYHLEEMKEIIWPSLNALAILRRGVNDLEPAARPPVSKHA